MPVTAHAPRIQKKDTISQQTIRRLREQKLVLSRTGFARLLKVSENTVFRWEAGRVIPDTHSLGTLRYLNELCDVLEPSMPPQAVAEWLERPNQAIDNFRPIDLIDFEYGRRKLRSLIEETGLQVSRL